MLPTPDIIPSIINDCNGLLTLYFNNIFDILFENIENKFSNNSFAISPNEKVK